MLDWLERQAAGKDVLDHKATGRRYLALLADRGTNALKRTAIRMKLDLDTLPHALLKPGADVLSRIEIEFFKAGKPEVLFIEGVDMLSGDPSKPELVGPFLDALGDFAHHYHVAVIGSTGSPKMTAKNGYVSTRDKIIGSTMWGRKVETIIFLNRESGKETDDITIMTILPRNAAAEEHKLRYSDGRLQVIAPGVLDAAQASKNQLALHEWIREQETFTRADCKRQFKSMNGSALSDRLNGFLRAGLIKQRTKGAKVWYEVPQNLNAQPAA
jgi:hypothetical protein